MSQAGFISELPIVQAPMAGVQDSALTIAVTAAGGVGSLPCAMLSSEALESELDAIKAAGVGTYNLNFFCHRQPLPDAQREAVWRRALAPYYREYAIDPEAIPAGPGRVPFSAESLELIRPYRPPIVSFHFGLPERDWVEEIKAWGGQVWSSATTPGEAQWLQEHGADAVIAQGVEAGGHRATFLSTDQSSEARTVDLLTAITDVVSVPVIAAGGIAHPAHVRRVLDAGAWAVQIGTAYLCCHEAGTSRLHRSLLQSEAAGNTQVTNVFSGRPARGITNRLMRELGPMSDLAPEFPLATAALAPLRTAAEIQGRGDFSPLWCGTDVSGCRDVSAAEQTRWLASGCS